MPKRYFLASTSLILSSSLSIIGFDWYELVIIMSAPALMKFKCAWTTTSGSLTFAIDDHRRCLSTWTIKMYFWVRCNIIIICRFVVKKCNWYNIQKKRFKWKLNHHYLFSAAPDKFGTHSPINHQLLFPKHFQWIFLCQKYCNFGFDTFSIDYWHNYFSYYREKMICSNSKMDSTRSRFLHQKYVRKSLVM